jgi:peptide/nickel transport system ATP-binding protein
VSASALEIDRLSVAFVAGEGLVRVVDEVSLTVARGELHGLVGESGCGKSTLARAALRVLGPPAVITGGAVRLGGEDLLRLDARALDRLRWRRASIVVQGALDALNPVLRVEEQLTDGLRAHGVTDRGAARRRARELLELVSLPGAALRAYPHELSGGMRQRVVIAMALALSPDVVVMDEPTTALDVVVQAEILDEVDRLRRALGFAVLLVSHDLPLMLERCDRISVMYAGRVVESAPVEVFRSGPSHPYARRLVEAFPRVDGPRVIARSLPGAPPGLDRPPPGCRFHPRCAEADDVCAQQTPTLVPLGPGHVAACHRPGSTVEPAVAQST